jgi:beta-ribofuranosylaminobenzene 5'-phosphate synthase
MTARFSSIRVVAPARLHLGFLDPAGHSGRRFGSLGVALDELCTEVYAEPADSFSAIGPEAKRAHECLLRMDHYFGLPGRVRLTVTRAIPPHAGLGSGTQLALAVGTAVARLFDLALSSRQLAAALARGMRSGIGIGAFDRGGFLVDGGKAGEDAPPAITCRIEFPENWRILLIFDERRQGLHGEEELAGFSALPAFPEQASGRLCRLTLMNLLPALVERDLEQFGAALSELQRSVGDHFAPAQGGRFSSPDVAAALKWLESRGVTAVGQSSWGPTGFAVVESEIQAHSLAQQLRTRLANSLSPMVCRAGNRGAEITCERALQGESLVARS